MARTIAEIQAQMDNEQALQSGLSGLNSPSKVAIYTLWKYITSVSIWIHESLWDLFKQELESISEATPPHTAIWLRNKVLEFQYSATILQVVELINMIPQYRTISDDLKIITRVSVKTLGTGIVSVKVAKEEPPVELTTPEKDSLTDYLETLSPVGVTCVVTSLPADRLYIDADIYYDGQYSAVISDNTITAINNYLANLEFDGFIRVSNVVDAIQSVIGVKDVVIKYLAIRDYNTNFPDRINLVSNKTLLYNKYPTFSGYIKEEDSPYNFANYLNFIPEK